MQQNAVCLAMFPAPLPRPGFVGTTLTSFQSCVPALACPGVDASAVDAVVAKQLAGSSSDRSVFDSVVEDFMAAQPPSNFSGQANSSAVFAQRSEWLLRLNISSSDCARGYDGFACKDCASGFYRFQGQCMECPKRAFMLIVGFGIGLGEYEFV